MTITDAEAEQARALLTQHAAEQHEKRTRKTIPCAACERRHQIGKLDAIATHWYVRPSGCSDGDYWVEGEFHFVCPDTSVRNRLLFWDSYDAKKAGVNACEAFKNTYRKAFRSVTAEHDHGDVRSYRWVNNDHIDKHRREWGLPEWVPAVPGRVTTP